jgi:hypothetical protein
MASILTTGGTSAYVLRFEPSEVSLVKNLLVCIADVLLNAYLLCAALFTALWLRDQGIGRCAVIGCLAILTTKTL